MKIVYFATAIAAALITGMFVLSAMARRAAEPVRPADTFEVEQIATSGTNAIRRFIDTENNVACYVTFSGNNRAIACVELEAK